MADMQPQGGPRPDVGHRAGHEDGDDQGQGHPHVRPGARRAGRGHPRRPRPGHASASPGGSRTSQAAASTVPGRGRGAPRSPDSRAIPAWTWCGSRSRSSIALNHYGWINKEAGIAHIPIDRAMDILAQTGLPGARANSGNEPRAVIPRRNRRRPTDGRQATNRGEIQAMRTTTKLSSAIVIAVLGVMDLVRRRDSSAESTIGDMASDVRLRPEAGRPVAAGPSLPRRGRP